MNILRTLGIVGLDQKITPKAMRAYDGVFAASIPLAVLAAIATLVDREIPPGIDHEKISPSALVAPIAT